MDDIGSRQCSDLYYRRQNTSYLSVVVCFTAFLVNDIYGFINWCRMGERQSESV